MNTSLWLVRHHYSDQVYRYYYPNDPSNFRRAKSIKTSTPGHPEYYVRTYLNLFQVKSPRIVLGRRHFCTHCFETFWSARHQCEKSKCGLCKLPKCTNLGDVVQFEGKCDACGGKILTKKCENAHICFKKKQCRLCLIFDRLENFSAGDVHFRHCGQRYCRKSDLLTYH